MMMMPITVMMMMMPNDYKMKPHLSNLIVGL